MDRLTDLALYRKARALGAYWDAVVHRAPTPPLPAEDAELGALIRRMHGAMGADLRDTSPGDPLLTNLLAKHQEMNDEMNILSTTTLSLPVRTVPTPRTRSRPSALPDASR